MAKGHALIVDDSSTARIMLARLLAKTGLTTREVATAEEAIDLLRTELFDLIFLDHLLPGMDGFEALKIIKNDTNTAQIPVFMYTSQSARRYLNDAKNLGAAGVIGKQVDRNQLVRTIEQIMENPSIPHVEPDIDSTPAHAELPADIESRRLTGRLSTLEVAYEEAHDELHQLKRSIARIELAHQEQQEQRNRKRKWIYTLSMMVFSIMVLALATQTHQVSNTLSDMERRLTVVQGIVATLMDLVTMDSGGE
jgi:CheY-like chemotaxis protein